ncbi:ABC transporter substrate-binding protein [Chromatiales bacterium (ex Bugula neritina AB1)]|nr:ABC transporter substrate-binding protein [Chromatiales bacterium (ex Bugula neritina AB1)]
MKRTFSILFAVFMICCGSASAARTDLVLGMQLEPPNLDPTGAAAAAIDEVVYANIFEGLTRFASDGSVIPALAKSWEISADGLTYTFALQSGVKFHNGSLFDATDVKFSLDRARSENSTNAQKQLFSGITAVDVVDSETVSLTLDKPNGALLFNLAWGDAIVLSPDSFDKAKTAPVGTGPFVFSRWVQGDRIEITKNPDYWGEPAKLDKATFKFISEPTAAFAALMAGDVDVFPVFPAPENLAQFDADPRFTVVVGSTEGETILSINNKQPPFDDRLVRKAVAHAIDREAIVNGAMFGYGTPIGTHFAPHNPAYVDLTGNSSYDPEKSKALLIEAGLANGFTTTLKLPPPSYARRGGEIIAAQLRAVGINAEISNLEWAQWLEQVFRGKDFGLTIVSHTEPMDIGIYAKPDYYFQYDNADFQQLIADLDAEADADQRMKMMRQAQQIISEDYVNGYLFQLAKTGVANADIVGLWENSPTQANDLTAVHWK